MTYDRKCKIRLNVLISCVISGIAGASTNLQASDLGDPIDSLVVEKLRAGVYEPKSIYYPARGQYWGWFGSDVFVATFNDEGTSWSRYVFPEALTDATLLNNDLYLRTSTHKVWKVDSATLTDDVHDLTAPILAVQRTAGVATASWVMTDNTLVTGFRLYRSMDGGAFALLTTLTNAQLSYEDASAGEGAVSYYVTAYLGDQTAQSNTVNLVAGVVPAAFNTDALSPCVAFAFDNDPQQYPSVGASTTTFNWDAVAAAGGAGSGGSTVNLPTGLVAVFIGDEAANGFVMAIVRSGSTAIAADVITSVNINGATYLTASATSTVGFYTGLGYSTRYWTWAAPSGVVAGNTYPVVTA